MEAGRGWAKYQNSNVEGTVRPSCSRSSPTCDRYGCAAAGDREAALLGLAILSAGGRYGLHMNHAALMRQRHDLRSVWMLIGEWLGSHPPLSKRLWALASDLDATDTAPVGSRLRELRVALALVLVVVVGAGA